MSKETILGICDIKTFVVADSQSVRKGYGCLVFGTEDNPVFEKNFSILANKSGELFVVYSSYKNKDGKHVEIDPWIDLEERKVWNDRIIEDFNERMQSSAPKPTPKKEEEKKPSYSNQKKNSISWKKQ